MGKHVPQWVYLAGTNLPSAVLDVVRSRIRDPGLIADVEATQSTFGVVVRRFSVPRYSLTSLVQGINARSIGV